MSFAQEAPAQHGSAAAAAATMPNTVSSRSQLRRDVGAATALFGLALGAGALAVSALAALVGLVG